jgi:hypothetical protein
VKRKYMQDFADGNLKGRDHLEDLSVDGSWKGEDCIDLSKDRDKRRALVNAVMNFHVAQKSAEFLD